MPLVLLGQVIISQEPYVSVPTKTQTGPSAKCEWCFTSTNVKKCSACQVVYYCGATCQKSDWKLHRFECQSLLKVERDRIKSLAPTIRLMVKLYLRRKLQNHLSIELIKLYCFDLNVFTFEDISDIDEKQLVLYAQMANLVNLILQWTDINIKEIAENFSKFACNAHTICDSELKPLGTGLYPVISIINHSCLPNSVLVFEGRLAVVRAVQHIKKGTEVIVVTPLIICIYVLAVYT
nr:histone-lysine N-methyltransferase ASHR1 [Ipomoea batatas]